MIAVQEYQRGAFTITTNTNHIDPQRVHDLLHQYSYWANNRTLEVVEKSLAGSLNFGLFHGAEMVGFARVVTDYATFAWLCDVVVIPEERGNGLGKWLVDCVVHHPDLASIRRILLATRDAHELYRCYGDFQPLAHPERWMERFNPEAQ